ncbi:MAG TPA: hypothetical protein VIY30_00820, partial [Burkholderiaceae bacterium]
PKAYIGDKHGFDAAVPLEDIKEWHCPNDAARRAYLLTSVAPRPVRRARSWRSSGCKIVVDVVTGGSIQALCDARDRPQQAEPRGEG